MDLKSVYNKFPNKIDCVKALEERKWKGVPVCPYCTSVKNTIINGGLRRKCNNCNMSYSVTIKTIFHKTKIDLQKWFLAIDLYLNECDVITSRSLALRISVDKNTACFILMRLRNKSFTEFINLTK